MYYGRVHQCMKRMETQRSLHENWPAFKTFFAAEYHDCKEQERVNSSCANFHTANAAVESEVSDALEKLALTTTADHGVVADLTIANQKLTTINQDLTHQLATLVKQLSSNPKTTKQRGKPASIRSAIDGLMGTR